MAIRNPDGRSAYGEFRKTKRSIRDFRLENVPLYRQKIDFRNR